MENVKLKKLDNGITLITENLPDISTFSMGFFVKTGAMNETKKEELDKVTINNEVLRKYFPRSYTPKQMQDTIIKLLENWHKKRQKNMER